MLQHLALGAASALAANQFQIQTGLPSRLQFVVVFFVSAIFSSILSGLFYEWNIARKSRKAGCQPPHLRKHKLPGGIDSIRRIIKADKNNEVPEEFHRVYNEMGGHHTWKQYFFGTDQIFTVDPKNIQALLATQFRDFELGRLRRANFFPLLGNGIFTNDGKAWEHDRSMLRPQFARDQVADLELEEIHVQNMLKHMPADSHGWTSEANLSPLFFRLTLDSATEFLFGDSVQSQIAALPDGSAAKVNFQRQGTLRWELMAESFDSATHHLGSRGRYGELYWLHSPKAFFDDCKEVHRFADYYVQKALSGDLSQTEKSNGKAKYIFLNELVKATQDPEEVRSQLLNILLAGRDTTAGLLGWAFWLMVRHQPVFEKLRKIVLEEFGTYEKPRNITFANLKSCSYLQHVMNEVLRMYPSVPINGRRSVRDTTLPVGGGPDGRGPIFVPRDREIVYSVHVMHRRKDLWGEDADEFKPERWVGRKSGWEYLPFNGGPRICLGQQFALTEAGYVIVRLLQRYDAIENVDPVNVPKHQYSVTTSPLAVKIRMHEASSQ